MGPALHPPPQARLELLEPQICREKMKQQKLSWWKVGDVESRSSLSQNTSSSFPGVPPLKTQPGPPPASTQPTQSPKAVGRCGREGRQLLPSLQLILVPPSPDLISFLPLKYHRMMSQDCWECCCCSTGSPAVPRAVISHTSTLLPSPNPPWGHPAHPEGAQGPSFAAAPLSGAAPPAPCRVRADSAPG